MMLFNVLGNVLITEKLDKPNTYKNFCDGTIRGIREIFNNKLFGFFLIENHPSYVYKKIIIQIK